MKIAKLYEISYLICVYISIGNQPINLKMAWLSDDFLLNTISNLSKGKNLKMDLYKKSILKRTFESL